MRNNRHRDRSMTSAAASPAVPSPAATRPALATAADTSPAARSSTATAPRRSTIATAASPARLLTRRQEDEALTRILVVRITAARRYAASSVDFKAFMQG